MKYIFVTGGVVSGLGKGICAASLGRLLKQCGLRVKNQKFDPYFNVDPGTMSPFQHGEVFVTEDGAETDLDLGHYERFVDESLDGNASVSSGKVFWTVLNRERQGGYLGGHGGWQHRCGHQRDRWYGGGYRKPALSGGHPAGSGGKGSGKCAVYPCSAHRFHPRHRRAEKQANPAFCQGASFSGHPAGYSGLPDGGAHHRGGAA